MHGPLLNRDVKNGEDNELPMTIFRLGLLFLFRVKSGFLVHF